jgi:hypothetical protein
MLNAPAAGFWLPNSTMQYILSSLDFGFLISFHITFGLLHLRLHVWSLKWDLGLWCNACQVATLTRGPICRCSVHSDAILVPSQQKVPNGQTSKAVDVLTSQTTTVFGAHRTRA